MASLIEAGRVVQTRPGAVPAYKRYLDEMPGVPLQDLWTDIKPIGAHAAERLGYPTQKPLSLLERIIKSSSNEGDVVFDPFCGCGTAIYAAHLNNRKWIGCDIAILSTLVVQNVLAKRYGLLEREHYQIDGVPLSVEGARYLFERDTRQFQHWAVEMAGGFCNSKHPGDQGVDGRIYFETKEGLRIMVLSVKGGGHLSPVFARELRGTLEADKKSALAGLICPERPTKGMLSEAAKAGMFTYLGKGYPRIQIRTVDELLSQRCFDTPSRVEAVSRQRQGVLAL